MNQWFLLLVASSWLLLWNAGCASQNPTLGSKVEANILRLDDGFRPSANLGQAPVGLSVDQPVDRYAIVGTGRLPQYLIIIDPAKVDGELTLPVTKDDNVSKSAISHYSYLNHLLQAHRLFLRGYLEDADDQIRLIEEKEGQSYGTLILKSYVLLTQGQINKGAQVLKDAKSLFPKTPAAAN